MSVSQSITERWGDAYAEGVVCSLYHRSRLNLAMRLLKKHVSLPGKHCYDFGCGEGVFMRMLDAEGATSIGSDPSDVLIERAPSTASVGFVDHLEQCPDDYFDIIVALSVLPYMKDDERARFWAAAKRTCKRGGVILQLNPNAYVVKAVQENKWVPDPRIFPAFLQQHGFKELDRDFIGYFPMILKWPTLHRLMRWDKIAKSIGIRSRGGKVYNRLRLMLVPEALKTKRCTGYYSLAVRD